MERPDIKILAVSNVYCRLMNFVKKGDQELGHYHSYDHGTLLASGKLLVEKLDDSGNVKNKKEFTAPSFIFIEKDCKHILTALEDNTVATCIHALRTIDETIIDSDFYVEEKELADSQELATEHKPTIGAEMKDRGLVYKGLATYNKRK
jgi:hypothetical protein